MTVRSRTALLLILHGSPNAEANLPVVRLASRLEDDPRFDRVLVAYMECNEPSIPQALDVLASSEIQHVIAIPWFLHAGRHLVLDVPALLSAGSQRHPAMLIQLTDPVGTSPQLAAALEFRAHEIMDIATE